MYVSGMRESGGIYLKEIHYARSRWCRLLDSTAYDPEEEADTL